MEPGTTRRAYSRQVPFVFGLFNVPVTQRTAMSLTGSLAHVTMVKLQTADVLIVWFTWDEFPSVVARSISEPRLPLGGNLEC